MRWRERWDACTGSTPARLDGTQCGVSFRFGLGLELLPPLSQESPSSPIPTQLSHQKSSTSPSSFASSSSPICLATPLATSPPFSPLLPLPPRAPCRLGQLRNGILSGKTIISQLRHHCAQLEGAYRPLPPTTRLRAGQEFLRYIVHQYDFWCTSCYVFTRAFPSHLSTRSVSPRSVSPRPGVMPRMPSCLFACTFGLLPPPPIPSPLTPRPTPLSKHGSS